MTEANGLKQTYIVDSEGPAITGLLSSLDHKLVTLYCKNQEIKGRFQSNKPDKQGAEAYWQR